MSITLNFTLTLILWRRIKLTNSHSKATFIGQTLTELRHLKFTRAVRWVASLFLKFKIRRRNHWTETENASMSSCYDEHHPATLWRFCECDEATYLLRGICVPPTFTYLQYRSSGSALTAVGYFSVAGPAVWNCLPDFIRDPTISADCFRRLLKTYLFARY